jgi:hypothetical protein
LTSFDGPLREVVYIFEREGDRGGGLWWLVLSCGHSVSRKRFTVNSLGQMAQALFRQIEQNLAPKRARCYMCQAGHEPQDPALLIRAFGGEIP